VTEVGAPADRAALYFRSSLNKETLA
jgi:hypothetical protein